MTAAPTSESVTNAAMRLADQAKLKDGLRRELRERFDLDGDQIVEAVQLAASYRLCRRAFA
ncbi:hypothetical protein DEM27_05815 [Metarhizobium album]|uniref:Uncharacterized protein n=1 Tax=Metarhizobium album TaxID=2182425 RepID=A0A2U2DV30_9HYPH|nr:hypothetical protein [Rhizobium album]PWE57157.1 hypothetical protein DEM27_05815 [Rhizobium album]